MERVDPIRNKQEIENMKMYLKGKSLRNYLMFMLGISSALRVSDILNLKIKDVWNGKKVVKQITLQEQKTNKTKTFAISKNLENAIKEYITSLKEYNEDDYLIKSRQGNNKAITRQLAAKIIEDASHELSIEGNISIHSLRKTWAYQAYKAGYSQILIQEALNHSSWTVTKRYLGILQDELNEAYINLNL